MSLENEQNKYKHVFESHLLTTKEKSTWVQLPCEI